jgi:hypothetical protein
MVIGDWWWSCEIAECGVVVTDCGLQSDVVGGVGGWWLVVAVAGCWLPFDIRVLSADDP